ncbi:MAG: bifunctional NADH-specific enoyl-ACP reductase/trans-2-enoyl-CoA reductase, partial [Pseudomonadota bacterium]
MVIKPRVRGFLCTTTHPVGCAENVNRQITYVRSQAERNGAIADGPKRVLVIGASTGYGLASRIVAAFGCGGSVEGGGVVPAGGSSFALRALFLKEHAQRLGAAAEGGDDA